MADLDFDERYDDDRGPDLWTADEIADQITELFTEHRRTVFRDKVRAWAETSWVPAEQTAFRVGREARAFLDTDRHEPALVWAVTCSEIIVRDLTLKPIMVGLFLGDTWANTVADVLVGRRWLDDRIRKIAQAALEANTGFDVSTCQHGGYIVWNEIEGMSNLRHGVVHAGRTVSVEDARMSVEVAAGLYRHIVPVMSELCEIPAIDGYEPPWTSP